MPKTEIDYSSTIIYKITCKDPTIKDLYVGHTTNFVQRKYSHKQGCVNPNASNYKCKLYETIRTTGGWTNWTMEIINFFNCRDHYEARIKEQEYFVLLNATLNSIEPLPKPTEVIPKNTFIKEIATANIDKYSCNICNYTTSKQSDYKKHLRTAKHIRNENDSRLSQKVANVYECTCGKIYKYDTGYYRHKKTCIHDVSVEPITQESLHTETNWIEIIQMLIKENQEIRNAMITQTNTMVEQHKAMTEQNKTLTEIVKNQQPSNTNTNSHNTISHNNNYNITMFLADKCKDAQNMSEFIEVVKSKVDMMQIYEHGYVNGISKLFIDELKSMEVTERPLHCTDERRNTFYVHNNDAWNKDEDLKDTKKAISHISQTNLQQCVDWSKNVPDGDAEREDHITKSISLCKQACSGDDKNTEKIIKNISKEIPLNKQVISDILV